MDTYIPMPIPSEPDPQVAVLRQKLAEAEKKITELDRRVNSLAAICEILRGAIRKQGVVSDDEFVAIGEELKARKQAAVVPHCRHCGKTLQNGVTNCIYCGKPHGEVL